VQAAKTEYYQEAFRNITEPNSTWKYLRYLGLVKPRSSGGKLVSSLEKLNGFFCDVEATIGNPLTNLNPIYLGETTYDDSRFYWKNIESVHIINALRRCKSGSIEDLCGWHSTKTLEEGSAL